MDENPFPELKISNVNVMEKASERNICQSCGRKRMYFCYNCVQYMNGLENDMPNVKLPIKINIIKHTLELDSKSTAVHAVLLARDSCSLYSFPDVPQYNPDTDVLVFPSDGSVTVEEWAEDQLDSDQRPERVVFVDCTWNQIHPLINCPQLAGLKRIRLEKYVTKFWRPNGNKLDSSCLATIEAIYYFLREYHAHYLKLEYNGEYDNLLMIFKFMYLKIREFHDGGARLRAYRTKTT